MALPFLANFDHHTAAWWRNNNPTLGPDEVGIECDAVDGGGNPIFAIDSATGWAVVKMKIGTGSTRWNDLPFGNPTGEIGSNLDDEIAKLPPGTEYELVTEEQAKDWWAANQPEPALDVQISDIKAELTRLDLASVRPLRAAISGLNTPDDDQRLEMIERRAALLRTRLGHIEAEISSWSRPL